MSIASDKQLLVLISEVAALRNEVKDVQERLDVLEKKAKEAKTLSLPKNG